MKKTAKKLTLARETVLALAGQELAEAQGGAIYTQFNCPVYTSGCTDTGVVADSRRIC